AGVGGAGAAIRVCRYVLGLPAQGDVVRLGVPLSDPHQTLVWPSRSLDLRGAGQRLESAGLAARERDFLCVLLLYRRGFSARAAEVVDAARGAALEPELIFRSKRSC